MKPIAECHPAHTSAVLQRIRKAALPLLLFCIGAWGVYASWRVQGHLSMFYDQDLRYNEILCSHDGIDPFCVWDGTADGKGKYRGAWRPDFGPAEPAAEEEDGRLRVHAYPPWHTTFFWWYAWLPRGVCHGVALLVFVLSLLASLASVRRELADSFGLPDGQGWLPLGMAFLTVAPCWGFQLRTGNYGALLLLLFLFLVESLRRGQDILAALCLAVMMIKPQVALLFVLPLLAAKRWKVVAIAAIVCLVATLWPAHVYGCSPMKLLGEIPQIGAPYVPRFKGPLFRLFRMMFGNGANLAQMAAGMVVCGALSLVLRGAGSWFIRFMPALLVFPLWTYSHPYDQVLLVCANSVFAALALRAREGNVPGWCRLLLVALVGALLVGTMLQTGYETLRCLRGIDYKWRLVYKTFGFLVSIASIFSLFLVRRWLLALCRDTSAMRASDDFIP